MKQEVFSEIGSIHNLPNVLKLARQKAAEGSYTDSLKDYKKVLSSILNHISPMQDVVMREEWKRVIGEIKKETEDITNIVKLLRQVKQSVTPQQNTQQSIIPLRDNTKENKNVYKKSNVIVYMHEPKTSTEVIKKEVDAWDPPPPLERRRNISTLTGISKVKKFREGRVKYNTIIQKEIARNYSKPWNDNKILKSVNKSFKEEKTVLVNEKSNSFLHHYYPDGEGPDADLIRMLERDVVMRLPNVSFEDIAELNEAKNALKEAILLPLLMPSIFVVSLKCNVRV
jgi:katanin p60 ATPase-containing subunit A1